MTFIFGLGNPGNEYQKTRHNAGFMMIDELAQLLGAEWQNNKKLQVQLARVGELFLVKPQTFMNQSGQAVRAVIDYYQPELVQMVGGKSIETERAAALLWILHDDLDLELGSFKIQLGSGPKVHNGLISVEQHLGTANFGRVRMGVDTRQGDRSMPGSAFVLTNFTTTELAQLQTTIITANRQLLTKLGVSL